MRCAALKTQTHESASLFARRDATPATPAHNAVAYLTINKNQLRPDVALGTAAWLLVRMVEHLRRMLSKV